MSDPGISVAMCIFNGERFLPAQLESIAAQDRPPDELVVCDDGSSDQSVAIVREFAGRANFSTRLFLNESNLGSTKNFEQAISLCRHEIVALADQDDIWYRQKLARIEKAFRQGSSPVAVFSDADLIDDDSRLLGLRLWKAFSFSAAEQRDFASGRALRVLVKHPVVTGATMAFRRDLFEALCPIPSSDIHDRWISFLLAARGPFAIIADPLMQYRRHHEQQEGVPPQAARDLLVQARGRGAGYHMQEIARFQLLHRWLEERKSEFPQADRAREEIDKKIHHLSRRASLPASRLARIPTVVQEATNGRYWHYSAGWNSVFKDLLVA